jgi:hypothetical protein
MRLLNQSEGDLNTLADLDEVAVRITPQKRDDGAIGERIEGYQSIG